MTMTGALPELHEADAPPEVSAIYAGLRGAVGSVGAGRLSAVLHDIEHGPPLRPDDARLVSLSREADAVAAEAEALLG